MNDVYQLRTIEKFSDVGPFGNFLLEAGKREMPLAIAFKQRAKKLALSTKDEGWVIDMKSTHAPLVMATLRTHALDNERLTFVTRDLVNDLPALVELFADGQAAMPVFRKLAPMIVGDLTVAARVINQAVTPAAKFRNIEQDAFEIILLEPQYRYGIPPYYTRVGLPMAKLQAEAALFADKKQDPQWWVSYPELWIRVLASQTGDPTLTWAFVENRDPIETIATLFKVTRGEAELILLWAACGFDLDTFNSRFPARLRELPEGTEAWTEQIRQKLQTLSMRVNQMKERYWQDRQVQTIYNRRLRPGHTAGEGVAFRIFGTAEDIIAVAAVAYWQARLSSDIMITKIDGQAHDQNIRIMGVGPQSAAGRVEWELILSQLAPLASPLGQAVPLMPNVVIV